MDHMIEERDPMNLYEFYLQMLKELDTARVATCSRM